MKRVEKLRILNLAYEYAKTLDEIKPPISSVPRGLCRLFYILVVDNQLSSKSISKYQTMLDIIEKYKPFIEEPDLYWFPPDNWSIRRIFLKEIIKVESSLWNRIKLKLGLYPFPRFV